mmetsp:Transcript_50599/g.103038  ORF Transcript_50599/g.103038 Transcript_50599/m.103038 type:complete len:89 (-) Transcript_50599:1-267(-)
MRPILTPAAASSTSAALSTLPALEALVSDPVADRPAPRLLSGAATNILQRQHPNKATTIDVNRRFRTIPNGCCAITSTVGRTNTKNKA